MLEAPRNSIVIVTYNSEPTAEHCLTNLIPTLGPDDEVLIVDNASLDRTVQVLQVIGRRDERVQLILNKTNLGFSAAANLGIEQARGEYIALLNPDTHVTHQWLERMRAHFITVSEGAPVGAVGPISNHAVGAQRCDGYLEKEEFISIEPEQVAAILATKRSGESIETKLLEGFCLMVPRIVFEAVGTLDPELFGGNEDLDFAWRLQLRGYQMRVAIDVFIHHVGHVSLNSLPPLEPKRLIQESTDKLARKLAHYYGLGAVPDPVEIWGIDRFAPSVDIWGPPPFQSGLVSIVMLTLNQLNFTKMCVESLYGFEAEPFELVIVDNDSHDGTRDYLRKLAIEHDNIILILNNRNTGFAGGCNQGMACARGDYVLLLNNDVIVTAGWLTRMLRPMHDNPAIGIVGPRSNYVSGSQIVHEAPYDDIPAMHRWARGFCAKNLGHGHKSDLAIGFAMLIRAEVMRQIGGLDTSFGSGNFEDDDYCLRAQLAGWLVWIADDSFVYHFGSRTFIGERVDYRDSIATNWDVFREKWHIDIPSGSRPDLGSLASRLDGKLGRADLYLGLPPPEELPFYLEAPEIEGIKKINLLLLAQWDSAGWESTVEAYAATFSGRDPIALLVPNVSDATLERVEKLLEGKPDAPDVLAFKTSASIFGLVSCSQVVLLTGSAHDQDLRHAARLLGKTTLEQPDAAQLSQITWPKPEV